MIKPILPVAPVVVTDGRRPYQPLALTGHDQALEATRLAVDAVTADPHITQQIRSGYAVYTVRIQYAEDQDAVAAFAEHFGGTTTLIPAENDEGRTDVEATATIGGIRVTAWTRVPSTELEVDR